MSIRWLLVFLTALTLLAGCASRPQAISSTGLPPMLIAGQVPPLAQLPPFPQDRHTSTSFVAEVNGQDTYARSLNVIDDITAAKLFSGTNEISWGIWKFHPGMEIISSVQLVLDLPAGDEAYIALADYSANAWDFFGPVSVGGSLDLIDAKHRSSLGNTFIAVITTGGDSATVHKVILTSASDWAIVTVDNGGAAEVGAYSSLLIVNGNPAICYSGNLSSGKLKYARAADSEGISWANPIVFADGGTQFTSMAILAVNAFPAISYYIKGGRGRLDYVQATDTTGETWGSPLTVAEDASWDWDVGLYPQLALNKQNYPAIAYYDEEYTSVLYICAEDSYGDSWANAETAAFGSRFLYLSLEMDTGGNPLISYYKEELGVLQIVGMNPAGTDWNPPQTVDSDGDVGLYASGAIVNSDMAISYYDATNGHLKFAYYSLEHGEWEKTTVDSAENVGLYTSLALIGGKPAISYYDQANGDLKYVQADDTRGSAWGTPVTVDSIGDVGLCTSLAEVEGKPAISYYDSTNGDLKYAIYQGP